MAKHSLSPTSLLWAVTLAAVFTSFVNVYAATTPDVVAEIDGHAITAQEVDKALGAQLRKIEEQLYNLRRQQIEALVNERLLTREAAKRGISVQALLDAEVTSKVAPVTDEEIDAFYRANKERIKGDEAGVREKIRAFLQNQKRAGFRQQFLQSLRSQSKVVVHLKPPPVLRAEVSVTGAPVKGPASAMVTIVEFSDFECPFCKRVQPTLTQLLSRYGERIRLVYRDFPLDSIHPLARKAAEAARCAHDQGKFWEFHDSLYNNAPKLGPEELKAYAKDVGLDVSTFERCLKSATHQSAVQKDVEDGARLGITGTPAFFINGRMLSGAQPFEAFTRIIDEELTQAR